MKTNAMFVSNDQIRRWHSATKPQGRVSVLKQVERNLALIYEVNKSGTQKLKTAMDIKEAK